MEKVRELMEKQKLDYYFSFSPVNVYYMTNFANPIHAGRHRRGEVLPRTIGITSSTHTPAY
ncbi:MAG: aminopeptidase P family N-terminal domain-containing protein [Chloroflexi bacterium]|nr:aminopeptidase P family N-terminal domain-containing protein [Chloroflexota bacterium]